MNAVEKEKMASATFRGLLPTRSLEDDLRIAEATKPSVAIFLNEPRVRTERKDGFWARKLLTRSLAPAIAGAIALTTLFSPVSPTASAHVGADQLSIHLYESDCSSGTTLGLSVPVTAQFTSCGRHPTAASHCRVIGFNQVGTWTSWETGKIGSQYVFHEFLTKDYWWQTSRGMYVICDLADGRKASGWFNHGDGLWPWTNVADIDLVAH